MLMTAREATEYLRISRATLHRLVIDGALPAVRIRGARRFRQKDLDALIRRGSAS
jgi:excisionase family DNA binding protein